MGIALNVDWIDGREPTHVFITSLETGGEIWPRMMLPVRLKHFDGNFPIFVDPQNLHEIIDEAHALRAACSSDNGISIEALELLLENLEPLRNETGWEGRKGDTHL